MGNTEKVKNGFWFWLLFVVGFSSPILISLCVKAGGNMEKEKVFCFQCKWERDGGSYYSRANCEDFQYCNQEKNYENSRTNTGYDYKKRLCCELNKNNDCEYFEKYIEPKMEKGKTMIELLIGFVIGVLAVFGIKIKNKMSSNDKVDVLAKSLSKKIVEVPAHYKVEDL